MGLRDIGEALPPGFRFYPTDDELVCHYLYQKHLLHHSSSFINTLLDIDLHTCEPWQLPEVAKLNKSEWYFFSFRDRKYATGYRTNRATTSGYWKATGKDRTILDPVTKSIVGMRKTLVFYKNRAPNGIKTCWIMHEFRLQNHPLLPPKEDWVLCRVFQKPKSETNTCTTGEHSPTYDTVAAATCTSPPPVVNNSFTGGYLPFPPDSPLQRSQDSDIITTNFHNFPSNETNDIFSRFLFNMNFELASDDSGVPPVLDHMEFDGDDGSMIFI